MRSLTMTLCLLLGSCGSTLDNILPEVEVAEVQQLNLAIAQSIEVADLNEDGIVAGVDEWVALFREIRSRLSN